LRIPKIANNSGPTYTRLHAGRKQADVQPMSTECALIGGLGMFVDKPGVVRARLHTIGAADTGIVIHDHDAILTLERCLYRAHRHTRRVLTVVAQSWHHEGGDITGILMIKFVLRHNREVVN